jgi:hypothetical protein
MGCEEAECYSGWHDAQASVDARKSFFSRCNGVKGNRYVSFRCGVEEAMSWALGQDTWNYKQN